MVVIKTKLFVIGLEITGLIYTKYTCLYYGIYLLLYVCYPKSVSFIAFLKEFYIYDDILGTIWITDKKLLHFKPSKSDQILRVGFPRTGHICSGLEYFICDQV